MFSVSGWNISAPLKAQEDNSAAAAKPENPKKRKRLNQAKSTPVTAENVVDLWSKHIGDEEDGAAKRPKLDQAGKKKRVRKPKGPKDGNEKSPKVDEDDQQTEPTEPEPIPQSVDDSSAQKPKKDKKSNKDKKDKLRKPVEASNPTDKPAKPTKPTSTTAATTLSLPPAVNLTPLQTSMRAKLASARFRHLNQTLYTTTSTSALSLFTQNPDMFTEYHAGFAQQVEVWPENPVDTYIADIRARGAVKLNAKGERKGHKTDAEAGVPPLPRVHGECTIADLGCGSARLAAELQPQLKKLHIQIRSFDLAAPSPLIEKADIASLPLPPSSIDIAIFCLALMGTNWTDFIDEAWRVLRWRGELWVAEIKSRFAGRKDKVVEHSVGKKKKHGNQRSEAERKRAVEAETKTEDALAVEVDGVEAKRETDVAAFVDVLRGRGFVLDGDTASAVDMGNKMFVRLRFIKGATPVRGKNVRKEGAAGAGAETWKPKQKGKWLEEPAISPEDENAVLKPCVYKLR
ncbi:hypothetical protein EJ06DRAFT_526919 [Trichodelitschia bisporula]|uniref:Ribosomal RNA-processing protein 8 n=1 Tax=Trichodelitschia bisporula TaxID=703511 RepID=A0A6G1I5K0_9PEZI|nr:hypothetical protein EJ06DRAFT_526919 [Trichodelitschia bisporula]